jgi:hypothetical protein
MKLHTITCDCSESLFAHGDMRVRLSNMTRDTKLNVLSTALSSSSCVRHVEGQMNYVELRGVDPRTCHMQSERSRDWGTSPHFFDEITKRSLLARRGDQVRRSRGWRRSRDILESFVHQRESTLILSEILESFVHACISKDHISCMTWWSPNVWVHTKLSKGINFNILGNSRELRACMHMKRSHIMYDVMVPKRMSTH